MYETNMYVISYILYRQSMYSLDNLDHLKFVRELVMGILNTKSPCMFHICYRNNGIFKMRNWLVLERRFETRTIASWPPTVRGWTACTPTLLHDTSAIMPPTTMIVPCAFQYSCFLFLSMKKFINNDTTHTCACWIMKIYVFLAKRLKQLHLLLIHTTLRSHLITYRVTQIRDADFKRWIIWYIICEVLVEVVTIENIILFKSCVCGRSRRC